MNASADSDAETLLTVEPAVVLALLNSSKLHGWRDRGVLAVRGAARWDGRREIEVGGRRFSIHVCTSVLGVRDALRIRANEVPPIIITPLGRRELGQGICEHLIDHKPLNPNPAAALRSIFAASTQESNLVTGRRSALAILRQLGSEVLSPAPGGVLTRDLVMSAVTSNGFGLPADPSLIDLLVWSARGDGAQRWVQWRASTDPDLIGDIDSWLAERIEPAAAPALAALHTRDPSELLPLGMIAGLLHPQGPDSGIIGTGHAEIESRVALESHLGIRRAPDAALSAWASATITAIDRLRVDRATHAAARAVITRSERLADQLRATALLERSDHLPSGLTRRLIVLAKVATAHLDEMASTPGSAASTLDSVEVAWNSVVEHHLSEAGSAPAVSAGLAAVRLLRYLATPTSGGTTEDVTARTLPLRYLDTESWVDAAVNDAVAGASDPELAAVITRVTSLVRAKRQAQDREFAAAVKDFATPSSSAPLFVEQILDRVIVPIAQGPDRPPMMLVVLDGMSVAAAHDLIGDLTGSAGMVENAWQVAELDDGLRAAVAALPTVTEFSRCSLLSGTLAQGRDTSENSAFLEWSRRNNFHGAGAKPCLFHKADMDAQAAGFDLPSEVREAVEDTEHRQVIGAVLNTIDDSLDRSDPLRTTWNVATVRHLGALMSAAARVGRIVVLTSDHGHVIERRELGIDRRGDDKPARWRSTTGRPAGPDEVAVEGPRVLAPGGRAVLAVDEQLRYGSLKAGYHGGASPAELVVPVAILVSGEIPTHSRLSAASWRTPDWWEFAGSSPLAPGSTSITTDRARSSKRLQTPSGPALFDVPSTDLEPTAAAEQPDPIAAVVGTTLFQKQVQTFGRGSITSDPVAGLLRALVRSGGSLSRARAAELLGVAPQRAGRVLAVVGQVVNLDGVRVLSNDSTEVRLDVAVLCEQFGVKA